MNPEARALVASYATQRVNGPDHTTLPNVPKAIKGFQRFHGLVPDGIIGPRTRAVMRRTNTTLVAPNPLVQHRTTAPGSPAGREIYNT